MPLVAPIHRYDASVKRENGTFDRRKSIQAKEHVVLADPAPAVVDENFSVPTNTESDAAAAVQYETTEHRRERVFRP